MGEVEFVGGSEEAEDVEMRHAETRLDGRIVQRIEFWGSWAVGRRY